MNTFSNRVHFLPWVGHAFHDAERRLLILGESHHGSGEEPATFTQDVTAEYVSGAASYRLWTQIMEAVTGKPHWEIDRREFWSSVALYHYVQDIVPEGPRRAPAAAAFEEAEPAFFDVVDVLKPSHILAMGFRLWERMPALENEDLRFEVNGVPRQYGYYRRKWGRVAAMAIKHPSTGFTATRSYPVVEHFLTLSAPPSTGAKAATGAKP